MSDNNKQKTETVEDTKGWNTITYLITHEAQPCHSV